MLVMDKKIPQLAKAGDIDFAAPVMEPKFDGHRMLAFVRDGEVRMYARSAVNKTGKLPVVESVLSYLPDCVLDGEVIAPGAIGGDWSGVQSILGADDRKSTSLVFMAFDVLEVNGQDVRQLSGANRRELLGKLVDIADDESVCLAPQFPYTPESVATVMASHSLEGVIVKNPAAPYASGKRGHGWIKIKAMDTIDVVVTGATEGKGKFAGQIGALTFGQYRDGEIVERGQCSGMDDAMRAQFTGMRASGNLAGVVIEVRHMGVMPTGGIRHPQFKHLRTDKVATDCEWHDR